MTADLNVGGADKSSTKKKQDMINMVHIKQTERDQYFKALPGGHFYPVVRFHIILKQTTTVECLGVVN